MKLLSRLLGFGAICFYLLTPSVVVFAQVMNPSLVNVNAVVPPTCHLKLNTSSISIGGSVTLSWTSTNATSGAITNVGNVGPSGSINLLPSNAARTTYIGSFTGPGGTANCSVTVNVSSGGTGSNQTTTTAAPTATPTSNPNSIVSTPLAPPASGLVPCGYGAFNAQKIGNNAQTGNDQTSSTGCQACNLAQLIESITLFLIGLSIPIAAALFAYAGVLYFTSAGQGERISQAKGIFKNVIIGFLIAITAWLVINTALNVIFSQGGYSSGNWYTLKCTNPSTRPVTGTIGSVLNTVLSTNNNLPNGGSGGSGGGTAPGSAAYTTAQQETATTDALVALDDACSGGDKASCDAYNAAQNAGAITPEAKTQLENLCDSSDPNSESCVAVGEIYNPSTVTPNPGLLTTLNGGVSAGINPQMAAQLAMACSVQNLSDASCSIAQQIALNESSGGLNCNENPTSGASGCMQVLATTACGIDASISNSCSACLASKNSLSSDCSPVIQTISNNPQLGTNLGVQYIAQIQSMSQLQGYESTSGTCQITAAAYYAGAGNVIKAGGVIGNIANVSTVKDAPQYVSKACGS